jgi:hypothetical protein
MLKWSATMACQPKLERIFLQADLRALRYGGQPSPGSRAKVGGRHGDRTPDLCIANVGGHSFHVQRPIQFEFQRRLCGGGRIGTSVNAQWPPRRVEKSEVVVYGGYPGVLREEKAMSLRCPSSGSLAA